MTSREAVQALIDMAMADARQAEDLLGTANMTGSTTLQELIEDAFTLAAAGQKVLASAEIDNYDADEARVILALEAMNLVRAEMKASSRLLSPKTEFLH